MSTPDAPRPDRAAPDTTTLAIDRTVLALERTFQAWLRTGMTAMATGLGVAKFLQDHLPQALLLIIALSLIGLGMAAFLQAGWRYRHMHLRLEHLDIEAMPVRTAVALSHLLAARAGLSIVGLLAVVSGGG